MFRNIFVLASTVAGAWMLGNAAMQLGTSLSGQGLSGVSPMGGLLIAPSVLVGALCGALLGGLLYPRC